MKAKIAVYDSHEKAVNALESLANHKFPMEIVSLIGKSEMIDNHIHLKSLSSTKNTPAIVGMGAGTLIGLLSGIGVFTIPGFGFLYGAGALVGAIGGFDLGLITGGISAILLHLGIKKDNIVQYEEHLNQGKFIIIINGKMDDVLKAEEILHTEGQHLSID
ncbi:MAG: hypothetical protein H6587_03115 [Flavobacteriales bacterium]|nr:hypothetical protein [Flavobacteriales bacterium]MCB9363538.1 hypothetical protein [Flavobacteriales bacterium]